MAPIHIIGFYLQESHSLRAQPLTAVQYLLTSDLLTQQAAFVWKLSTAAVAALTDVNLLKKFHWYFQVQSPDLKLYVRTPLKIIRYNLYQVLYLMIGLFLLASPSLTA